MSARITVLIPACVPPAALAVPLKTLCFQHLTTRSRKVEEKKGERRRKRKTEGKQ